MFWSISEDPISSESHISTVFFIDLLTQKPMVFDNNHYMGTWACLLNCFLHSSFVIIRPNVKKLLQNRSVICDTLFCIMSISSFPGVVISNNSIPTVSTEIAIDERFKKFRWREGATDFDFSHKILMSTPVPDLPPYIYLLNTQHKMHRKEKYLSPLLVTHSEVKT